MGILDFTKITIETYAGNRFIVKENPGRKYDERGIYDLMDTILRGIANGESSCTLEIRGDALEKIRKYESQSKRKPIEDLANSL